MDVRTWQWWTFLRAVSVVNLVAYVAVVALVPLDRPVVQLHAVCAGVYTLVCAFRSFFPRVDLERTVLLDHPLSAIALGRSSATVAEMAFTVQCAAFTAAMTASFGIAWAVPVLWAMVPLIAVAQTCCWLGVLTLDHRWHAAEEVLWGVFMVVLMAVFAATFPAADALYRALLAVGFVSCAIGAYVMLVLDVPMYFRRHAEEVARGTRFLPVVEGMRDAATRRMHTGAWDIWKHEVIWMTPYFSAGVWLSIAMVWLSAG